MYSEKFIEQLILSNTSTIGVVVRMSILDTISRVRTSASICFLLEQETLSTLLQSTQLLIEYQVGTAS